MYPTSENDRQLVRKELAELLKTDYFANSKRYPALLLYVVEKTLEGRSEDLKERVLGIEVFQREPDYDTNSDTIVRVTAGEVRKRLGNFILAEDDRTLEGVVLAELTGRQGTLTVVDTFTGGAIAARVAHLPGAEKVFRRGIVARDRCEHCVNARIGERTIQIFCTRLGVRGEPRSVGARRRHLDDVQAESFAQRSDSGIEHVREERWAAPRW